jgi:hypothetical protein
MNRVHRSTSSVFQSTLTPAIVTRLAHRLPHQSSHHHLLHLQQQQQQQQQQHTANMAWSSWAWSKIGYENIPADIKAKSFYDLKTEMPGGKELEMADYKGKVVLIVNVASNW